MSNSKRKKKSTTKYKSSGFLIPAIAILETIVLIAVSSFAWYYYSTEKTLTSAMVTVKTDSGLEIDFKDAQKTDRINVWRYLDNSSFAFEPASSVDGRQIFFPTSGSFGSTDTNDMLFREGTGNDVNSKYVSIDFKLTNTSTSDMEVYLSGRSKFTLKKGTGEDEVGKALRLALYTNDGASGSVGSNFNSLHGSQNINNTNNGNNNNSQKADTFTVYFKKPGDWGSNVYAFIYDDEHNNQTINYYSDLNAYIADNTIAPATTGTINGREKTAWPGDACAKISDDLYSFTFQNPHYTKEYTYTDVYGNTVKDIATSPLRWYQRIVFTDGGAYQWPEQNETGFALNDDVNSTYLYAYPEGPGTSGSKVTLNTVYFLKPSGWTGDANGDAPLCRPSKTANSDWYNNDSGSRMTYVTTGIYSYSFPKYVDDPSKNYTYLFFKDPTSTQQNRKESNVQQYTDDQLNGKLYYFPDTTASGATGGNLYTTTYSTGDIYFYNGKNFSQPYAYVNAFAAANDYTYGVSMTEISDNIYKCTVPDIFLADVMSTRQDAVNDDATSANHTIASSGLANNCTVYFKDNSGSGQTVTRSCESKYIYYPDPADSSSPYDITLQNYGSYLPSAGGYAVISPGVSAGFQRSSNAVSEIDTSTGVCTLNLPSFASSFRDYILGSGNPLFTIAAGNTVNMSMIIWLEGTDSHCTADNYAGNNIDLYLELATYLTEKDNGNFTYKLYDRTKEIWLDNQTTANNGITVDPVMLMYDVTEDAGYQMKADPGSRDENGNVTVWSCSAPQFLADENTDHVIEFRRVNPLNEEEVWNRWHAGNLPDYRQYALDNSVVSFTVFGDSGPVKYKNGSVEAAAVNSNSACGGLWGNLGVQKLYVYDGRKWDSKQDSSGNRTIKAGLSDISGTTEGNLFIKYTYNYGSGKSQTIEYKCSDDGHFYCFVVPSSIITNTTSTSFASYVFKSGKAINDVDYQGEDVVRRLTTPVSNCIGLYYELNETYDNANPLAPDNCYWGSDIVYVQGPSTSPYLSVSYSSLGPDNSDHCKMRIVFCVQGYNLSVNPADSVSLLRDNYSTENTKTAYLYDDKQSSNTTAYNYVPDISEKTIPRLAAVVPSDKEYATYNFYRLIDRVVNQQKFAVSRSVINKPLSHPDGALNAIPDDTSGGTPVDQHVLYLEYDHKVCYIQATGSNAAVIHIGNNKTISKSGSAITSNNNTYYRYDVPSNVESGYIEFRNGTANSGTISFTDGTVYVSGGSSFSATQIGKPQYNDTIKTNITSGSRAADDNWIYFKD